MLDFLHEYFVLHLLLNATYVSIGIVVGRFLAWRMGVERRYRVRSPFVLILLLLAILCSVLITVFVSDPPHFWTSIVGGLAVGFGTAYWSRRQAKPAPPRPARAGASRRPK